MNKRIPLLGLLLLSSSTFAIAPASKQQILCNSTHVVTGKVIAAERTAMKCGPAGIGCASGRNPDLADLSIKVTDILAVKDSVASFPRDVGISKGSRVALRVRAYALGDPSSTAADVERMFVGKDFVFSILVVYSDTLTKDGQILKDYLAPPPYWAETWSNENHDWLRSVLSKSDGKTCPK